MLTAPAVTTSYRQRVQTALSSLSIPAQAPAVSTGTQWMQPCPGKPHTVLSPVDGEVVGVVNMATPHCYEHALQAAEAAFPLWRAVPAPRRGEVVRQIGDAFRKHKAELGMLVSYEMGKLYQEGLGEVQEIIDICDYAVGLSRQLYGLTMPSERPDHRLMERWHPLGIVGIISAFNFPVAVWSWNAMLAAVCGDVTVWKPSEKTPLTAVACMNIIAPVLQANQVPEGVFCLVNGEREIGEKLAADPRVALVSATGSTRMGKAVAQARAQLLGKNLLELGGNNAIIITPSANLEMALQATLFAAVGTAGQRCTTARRLIVHSSIYGEVKKRLLHSYSQLVARIGNPLEEGTLIGPLVDKHAADAMADTLEQVEKEGGSIIFGKNATPTATLPEKGAYVVPCLVEAEPNYAAVQKETFAPILYLLKYDSIEQALNIQNNVPQGLSSSIFTTNLHEAEYFLSQSGSDCGIANVNVGPSGAEIGGAFGGEKETGGGRESGADAWRAYMRRQTVTINYSHELPLAQGIQFDLSSATA